MGKYKYSPETKQKISNYRTKYNRKHYVNISIKLNAEKDKKLIEVIKKNENVTDYIRKLVMKEEGLK